MRDEFYPLVTKRRNFDSKDKSDSFFTIVNCPFVTPKWRPSISCSVRKWLLGVVRRLFSISPFGQETKCSLVFFATHTVKWTPKMAGWSIGEKEKVFPHSTWKETFFEEFQPLLNGSSERPNYLHCMYLRTYQYLEAILDGKSKMAHYIIYIEILVSEADMKVNSTRLLRIDNFLLHHSLTHSFAFLVPSENRKRIRHFSFP